MTGKFYLRNNGDLTGGGICHHFFYLFLGVKAPADTSVYIMTNGAYLCQQRIFFHFNRPQVVVRQMPMEIVHLEHCHQVELLLDEIHIHKITADIKHHAAISKTRFVFYGNAGKPPMYIFYFMGILDGRRKELHQGLHPIKESAQALACHVDFMIGYIQPITFFV